MGEKPLSGATALPENPEEIEVTPKMIEAGVDALGRWDVSQDRLDWIVEAIYRAMRSHE